MCNVCTCFVFTDPIQREWIVSMCVVCVFVCWLVGGACMKSSPGNWNDYNVSENSIDHFFEQFFFYFLFWTVESFDATGTHTHRPRMLLFYFWFVSELLLHQKFEIIIIISLQWMRVYRKCLTGCAIENKKILACGGFWLLYFVAIAEIYSNLFGFICMFACGVWLKPKNSRLLNHWFELKLYILLQYGFVSEMTENANI